MLQKKYSELAILIEYGAPKDHQKAALNLTRKYPTDPLAINIFHKFYSALPEALDDYINKLSILEINEGLALFLVSTGLSDYFYLVNHKQAELVATLAEGLPDDILKQYGYNDENEFKANHNNLENIQSYQPDFLNNCCPACFTSNGENHTFGCPVEVCPWCDGILTNCNCRFEQMGVNEVKSPEEIKVFKHLLEHKGRVAYNKLDHKPAYPTAGDDEGLIH